MRIARPLLLTLSAAALVACGTADTEADGTAATGDSGAGGGRATPTPLSPADLRGTWNGATIDLATDSVLRRWTSVTATDSSALLVLEGSRDSIPYTVRLDADSAILRSAPYRSGPAADAPQVTFRSIGRLRDGKLVGTVTQYLASQPDSIVARARFESSRVP